MRTYELARKTQETDIKLSINLDGTGKSNIKTGCGFLDHMLVLFARHGHFDLNITCDGDTYVDYHHSVEDVGILLGQAFLKALGDMKGIKRYASIILPMDEALILCAADISGRSYLAYEVPIISAKVGDFDTELVEEFLLAFTRNSHITLHIKKLSGINTHHIIEGCFKAIAKTLYEAVSIENKFKDEVPSTKGVL